jgi:FemAB-related protein (PEP-CTERM system-associated)
MKPTTPFTIVRPQSPKMWDRFVEASPESNYCHLFGWGRIIQEVYRHEAVHLAAEEVYSGRILGVFPLVRFKPFPGKARYISLPFFDQVGILADTPTVKTQLFRQGLLLAKSTGSSIEIRRGTSLGSEEPGFPENGTSTVSTLKVSMSIPLGLSAESLMRSFRSKLRSQILKSSRNGLKVRIGKQELLRPFYQVFSRNMRDLGSPVHAFGFFESIFRHFHGNAFICCVYHGSLPVAAGFMFRFRDTLHNPWASSLRDFRHLGANMLLYWEMLRFSCSLGLTGFDMGRSSRGASTHAFKKQWSPLEQQLYWYQWFPGESQVPRYGESLTIGPWKRLPLVVANSLGPLVRGRISL